MDKNIEVGTTVSFFRINEDFNVGHMKHFLNIEFCWFLELMKNNEFQLLITKTSHT